MKKTAVIYDKWLDSMGGGEMVACSLAQHLVNKGYEVTIICRKIVPLEIIYQKLNIQLKNIKFIELWNDETKLQKITKGKDLFINISFIDYSVGLAKINLYYAHFPTPLSSPLRNIVDKFIVSTLSNYVKPVEFIDQPLSILTINRLVNYKIGTKTSLAFSYLKTNRNYNLKFFIYHEQFSLTSIKSFNFNVTDAVIVNQKITVDHRHNVVRYQIKVKPSASTIYFSLSNKMTPSYTYLIEPHLDLTPQPTFINRVLESKFYGRLRAGLFDNTDKRLNRYQKIIVHSKYVAQWVKKYWHKESVILYPPIEILSTNRKINYDSKKNIICSVGRFFTLGHSKKQDILITAFKNLCNQGLNGWELHLAGGLGNEPTSLAYFEKLKYMAEGYPIYFHVNKSRSEIIDLYFSSKIYWHAAGFGEDKNKKPINFEHFGITPIEAISAGCTPLLFNGGGLPEIIDLLDLDQKLYLFSSVSELERNTSKLIKTNRLLNIDQNRLKTIFGEQTFYSHFDSIIEN